jgi:hypothetical protein
VRFSLFSFAAVLRAMVAAKTTVKPWSNLRSTAKKSLLVLRPRASSTHAVAHTQRQAIGGIPGLQTLPGIFADNHHKTQFSIELFLQALVRGMAI